MRTDIVNRSFIDVIAKKAMKLHPFQSKAISRFHESIDSEFASISNRYLRLFFDPIDKVDEAVDSFITMSKDFLRCQIRFQETREYPVKNQAQAYLSVYSDKQVMSYYMRGLYLSYFLWPNHWQILKYFRECLMIVASRNKNDSSDALRVLEVAPGHGLFTANIFELIKSLNFLHLVDISETSLSIARENLSTIGFVRCEKITFICADFTNYCAEHEFDFIVMGEVLEHVDDPVRFLIKIKDLLSDKGFAFITTCTDAPAIDHCFHYRHCDEVRVQIEIAGLKIFSDLEISSVPGRNVDFCYDNNLTVNYCALVTV